MHYFSNMLCMLCISKEQIQQIQAVAARKITEMSAMTGVQVTSEVQLAPIVKGDTPAEGEPPQAHQSEPLCDDAPDPAAAAVSELLLKLLATSTCGLAHCLIADPGALSWSTTQSNGELVLSDR